jgi:hypothetical protein
MNTTHAPTHGGYPGEVTPSETKPVTLDRVTTIAIGDLDANGTRIPDHRFRRAVSRIDFLVTLHGGTVYAVAYGEGVTSDQPEEQTERSAIILCGNVEDLGSLRKSVSVVLETIGGSSACFATDHAHEPTFAHTEDGFRA